MLTILNIINYLIGRPLSSTMLITVSIAIYAVIITTFWDSLVDNTMYLIILLILLILDIATIIVISTNCISPFTIFSKDEDNISSDMKSNIVCEGDTCKIIKKTKKKKKIKKDKIPVYDGKTNTTINTYN